ncbi:MAG: GTPase Era [Coriobacteriia bacterium]|nr:GTPase Era [Coriobacteriia bacterium]
MPLQHDTLHSGFLTLVGRPNVGKSTLLNAIMGKKIAITSSTAQTTRHRFRGIYNRPNAQLIIVDTPGVHKPQDALGEELNESAMKGMEDVDVVAFLLDASMPFGRGDEWVLKNVARSHAQKVLVVSKVDKVDEQTLQSQIDAAREKADWDAICPLSSVTGEGIEDFIDEVCALLPEGPRWFPEDMETDQPLEVMIAEFIREKILYFAHDEVPHAVGVVCEELEYDRKKKLYRIYALIYVERESQKGIIIGKHGHGISRIGKQAREDLEQLLGKRVYLDLRVKVRKNWRRDLNQIKRFGYGEGN